MNTCLLTLSNEAVLYMIIKIRWSQRRVNLCGRIQRQKHTHVHQNKSQSDVTCRRVKTSPHSCVCVTTMLTATSVKMEDCKTSDVRDSRHTTPLTVSSRYTLTYGVDDRPNEEGRATDIKGGASPSVKAGCQDNTSVVSETSGPTACGPRSPPLPSFPHCTLASQTYTREPVHIHTRLPVLTVPFHRVRPYQTSSPTSRRLRETRPSYPCRRNGRRVWDPCTRQEGLSRGP